VRRASELRSTPAGPADEIADPFGRSRRVARATADEVRRQTLELARRLFDIEGAHMLLEPPP
jgi:hypothetical protein